MNSKIKTFTQRLELALAQGEISKTNLSLLLEVSPASISAWFKGKTPSTENLIKISSRLNISLCWLINGYGPMNLYGPMHISPEEELLLQLRFFPDEIFDHLFNFLAATTKADSNIHLLNRARAMESLSNAKIAMAVIDTQGHIKDINKEYLVLLGLQEEHKTQVVDSFFIDWVSNESKAETILKIKDAFRNREHTYGDNFICELIQYQSSKTSKVALSGVLHGGADHGFFLVTAFLLT